MDDAADQQQQPPVDPDPGPGPGPAAAAVAADPPEVVVRTLEEVRARPHIARRRAWLYPMLEALAADGHKFAIGMQARPTDPDKEDVYFAFSSRDDPAPQPLKSIHCPKRIRPKLRTLLGRDHPAVKLIDAVVDRASAAAAVRQESSASSEDDEDASDDDDDEDLRTLAQGARLVQDALGALRRKRDRDGADAEVRAEVERLRAANQRLRTHVEQLEPTHRDLAAARGEIQQLRAASERQSARLVRAGAFVQGLVRRMTGADGRLTPSTAAQLVVIAADAGVIDAGGQQDELQVVRRFAKEEDGRAWTDAERQAVRHLLGHVARMASGMEAMLADILPS